jgi:HEAT repeat protein
MRFAVTANDPRVRVLVDALDRDDVPIAETWRKVGEASWNLGLRRPGYHLVRGLAQGRRAVRAAKREVRKAAAEALLSVGSPYVVRIPQAFDRLEQTRAREKLVSQQHKRSPADDP